MPNLSKMAHELDSTTLANLVRTVDPLKKPLIVDCRCFLDYNLSHIRSAVNAFYSKMMRRRLFDNKISSSVMLSQLGHHHALHENHHELSTLKNESGEQKHCNGQLKQSNGTVLLDLVLYCERDDNQQSSNTALYPFSNFACNSNGNKMKRKFFGNFSNNNNNNNNNNSNGHLSSIDFLRILQQRLTQSKNFNRVWILQDGFGEFRRRYPDLCEASSLVTTPPASTNPSLSTSLSSKAVNDNCFDPNPNRRSDRQQFDQSRSTHLPHELTQSTYSTSTYNATSCTATSVEMPFSASISQPCLPATSDGPTEILPYLYLGSQQDALDPALLNKYGIQYVINLSVNCPRPESVKQDGHFMRIPVNDSYQEKLLPHFEEAFKFVDKVCQCGSVVLIHCLAGISRSATLAIAYIMRQNKWTSEQAYRFVKEKRPSISPNFNFMGQLLEYETKLREQFGLVSSTTPSPYTSPNDNNSPRTRCLSPNRFSFSHSESFSSSYRNKHQRSSVVEPSSELPKVCDEKKNQNNNANNCIPVECKTKVAKSISCEHILSTNVKLARPRSFWDNDNQEPSFKMNANGKRVMQFSDDLLFSTAKGLPHSSSISAPNTASVATVDGANIFAGTSTSTTKTSAVSTSSSNSAHIGASPSSGSWSVSSSSMGVLDRPCVLSGCFSLSKQQQQLQPEPQNLRKSMAANMLGERFPQIEPQKPDLPSPTTALRNLSFQNTIESGDNIQKLVPNQSHCVTNPFFASLSSASVNNNNVKLKCHQAEANEQRDHQQQEMQYCNRLTSTLCCTNPTFQCNNPIVDTNANTRRLLVRQNSDGGQPQNSGSKHTLPSCCGSASTSNSKCCSACRAPSLLKMKKSSVPSKLSASCHNLSPLQEEGEQSPKQSSSSEPLSASDRSHNGHDSGNSISNAGKCTSSVRSCPLVSLGNRHRPLDLTNMTAGSPRFLSRLSHCFSLNKRFPLSRYSLSMLQQQQQQIHSSTSHRCHNHRPSSAFPLSLSSETLSSDLSASYSRSPSVSSTESSESYLSISSAKLPSSSSSKPSSYRPNLVQSQSVILTGTSTKSQKLPTVHEFVLSQSDTEKEEYDGSNCGRGELMGIVDSLESCDCMECGFIDDDCDDVTPTAQRIMLHNTHKHPPMSEHTVSSSSTSGLGTSTTSSTSMDFATSASESFHDADRDSISSASSLEIVVQ